jgi:hypothetical protein
MRVAGQEQPITDSEPRVMVREIIHRKNPQRMQKTQKG